MAVNSIFHTNNKNSILTERNLYKDLIKEAAVPQGLRDRAQYMFDLLAN